MNPDETLRRVAYGIDMDYLVHHLGEGDENPDTDGQPDYFIHETRGSAVSEYCDPSVFHSLYVKRSTEGIIHDS